MADFELPGYELYERLGRGGMATVYRALHLNLDREVAIKVMDPSMNSDENFSERFIREARISARLTHPHILQIYDVNTFNGLNYIAMELLSDGELADFIHADMPQKQIYLILQQMTDALDYAAGRGYIHRDIKPSNIMRRSQEDYVLADFGIARAANSGTQMTQTGLMVGTPSYMSPEQAKGEEVDGRSDLYALAVLAFEMLTKTLPYESDSAVTTAVKHLTEDIPTLPDNLVAYQDFLNKGLAKSADDRFQTGRELYEAFMRASSEFADEDVLTDGIEPQLATESGLVDTGPEMTSLAGMGSTRMSHSSSPSVSASARPYRLDGSAQRERLVSDTYSGNRRPPAKSGNAILRIGIIVAVMGGLAYGGYTYWQNQQGGASKDLANVTAELASAYSAMNDENLKLAASFFYKALQQDSGNAAAQQGMDEVERLYKDAIESAISDRDLPQAKKLVMNYADYFSSSSSVERYQADVSLIEEQLNLAQVQAERIQKLVDEASVALAASNFDAARSLLKQAEAIDASSEVVALGQAALEEAEAASEAYRQRWAAYSADDRQTFSDAILLADTALDEGDLDLARQALSEAALIAGDAVELTFRTERLAAADEQLAVAAAQQQTRLEALLEQADSAVAGIAADPASARLALDLYAQVDAGDPGNSRAAQGVSSVTAYYVDIARSAAADGEFGAARAALGEAGELVPDAPEVPEMLAAIETGEKAFKEREIAAEKAREKALASAQAEAKKAEKIAARGQRSLASGALEVAQSAYTEASRTHPDLEEVKQLGQGLRDAYAGAAREQVDLKEFEAAQELVTLASGYFPEDDSWAQLAQEIEAAKANNRRRLGAY